MSIRLQHLTFTYPEATEPLFSDLTWQVDAHWTAVVGPNGSGKTTLLRLVAGELSPDCGQCARPGLLVLCPQRTDEPPARWQEFMTATEATAIHWRGVLAIDAAWLDRWPTLSHGERKRVQVAVALWQNPMVLLVDEPTNHLDLHARDIIERALLQYQGIGLLVSHDRDLLDRLCSHTLLCEPPTVRLLAAGFTAATQIVEAERLQRERERESARRELRRLQREATRRHDEARRADGKRSKRHLDRHDSDGRGRINLAIVTGKDGQAGRLARQLDNRVRRAQDHLDKSVVKKRYDLAYALPGGPSSQDTLLRLPAGCLPLGADLSLDLPNLIIQPTDRIALTGDNGSGKSSLVRHLLSHLTVPASRVVYIPQEVDPEMSARLFEELRTQPRASLGATLAIVSCLGSRPERLLDDGEPSPGEIRKVMLACGIARHPHLIVMDEPTNHLDLPAIELLEQALARFTGALLMVSHDRRFLRTLTRRHWTIVGAGDAKRQLFDTTAGP